MSVNLNKRVAAQLLPVAGVVLGIAQANIKRENRKDLLVMQLSEGAQVAGVFTQNRFLCRAGYRRTRTSGRSAGHSCPGGEYR